MMITDTYVGGRAGSERYLYNLVTGLDPDEYQIEIVQLTTKTDIPYPQGRIDEYAHISVSSQPVGRVYGISGIQAFLKCRRKIKSENYDIVQSVHEKSDIVNAMLPVSAGRPVKFSSRRDEGFKMSARLKRIAGTVNKRIDHIIAPSRATADFVTSQSGVGRDSIEVIPNGVDTERFARRTPESRSRARSSIGVAEESFCIGCVANLKPVKGHDVLLQAFNKLLSSVNGKTLSLVLLGDGECLGGLQQLAADLEISNSIIFAGQRDDIHELLPAFDVVASSSFSEGMSNSLIEAASVGIPVVASNVGGNPEVVVHGSSGLLFAVGDYNDLYKQLKMLVANPGGAREMGDQARTHAEKNFGIKAKIAQHAEVYRRAVETRVAGSYAS